jgi:hypothetical protein
MFLFPFADHPRPGFNGLLSGTGSDHSEAKFPVKPESLTLFEKFTSL